MKPCSNTLSTALGVCTDLWAGKASLVVEIRFAVLGSAVSGGLGRALGRQCGGRFVMGNFLVEDGNRDSRWVHMRIKEVAKQDKRILRGWDGICISFALFHVGL